MGEYKLYTLLAMQMREIEEHMCYLKEAITELGYDSNIITLTKTMKHWAKYGYAQHFHERFDNHSEVIDKVCKEYCNFKCPGVMKGCVLSQKKLHEILEDGQGQTFEEKRELDLKGEELEELLDEK